MPEVMRYKDLPSIMVEFHVQPFLEEYIPGSIVLCREMGNDQTVFFQIPRPIASSIGQAKRDELKGAVDTWWLAKKD